ncbi:MULTISPECIES: hypothetical protein [Burkholderia cepacia complex]|uniref:hypothetical protein n=1 Tax=Burkholderia cepacia complex TaxID=87882 RepID=UPI0015770182|nr:hypothetical protein [Burkholderia diffusa]NTX20252.1 hypothetical protein [Burkholderia cepacia]
MKLGLSYLEYIPATTRAMLSRLGAAVTFDVDGQLYWMPSREMPDEVQWRVDYLQWMVRRVVHYLARRPRDDWVNTLLEVEAEAVRKHLLLNAESEVFSESVLQSLQDLTPSGIQRLVDNAANHDAELKSAGEALNGRLVTMVVSHGVRVDAVTEQRKNFKMRVTP